MSSTIDQQFVEFVVKTIVSNPDKVSIERTIDEKGVLLELTVDPEDLGRVIGKRGAAAQALRTLLRALGTKNDARYNLKIIDVGGERPPRDDRSGDNKPDDSSATVEPPKEEAEKVAEPEDTQPVEESKEEAPQQEEKDDEEQQPDAKSSFEKTRRELQDLDDLDI